jgi:hypothetical protein
MLLTIAIILLILWAIGFFAFSTVGPIIHILLVIAVIVFLLNFIRGRPTV